MADPELVDRIAAAFRMAAVEGRFHTREPLPFRTLALIAASVIEQEGESRG